MPHVQNTSLSHERPRNLSNDTEVQLHAGMQQSMRLRLPRVQEAQEALAQFERPFRGSLQPAPMCTPGPTCTAWVLRLTCRVWSEEGAHTDPLTI